jgi:hypothetical protein
MVSSLPILEERRGERPAEDLASGAPIMKYATVRARGRGPGNQWRR